MGFGWTETLLIFGIILLIFGPNKLPDLAESLGSSINVFKDELNSTQEALEDADPSDALEDEVSEVKEAVEEPQSEDNSSSS